MKIFDAVQHSQNGKINARYKVENGIGIVYIDGCPEPILVREGEKMDFAVEIVGGGASVPMHYWAEWDHSR